MVFFKYSGEKVENGAYWGRGDGETGNGVKSIQNIPAPVESSQ